MDLDISIDDKASPSLQALFEVIGKPNRTKLMTIASRASLLGVQDYYEKFNASDGWLNKSLPTHGPGRKSTGFGNKITEGWNVSKVSDDGYTLNNGAPWLGHKITGGTITPKRSKFLTIPLVPEAHGVRARDFPYPTFFAGMAIMADMGGADAVPVYALSTRVVQKPTKGAMAPDEAIIDPALESINDQIAQALGL